MSTAMTFEGDDFVEGWLGRPGGTAVYPIGGEHHVLPGAKLRCQARFQSTERVSYAGGQDIVIVTNRRGSVTLNFQT